LDFGYPYGRYRIFHEEYLKPRPGAGLLDLLVMGLLPPLEGIYRTYLEAGNVWQQLRQGQGYGRLEAVDGVLLAHAPLDHSGHISLLREDIRVYATATTAFIAKAMQDTGRAPFDQRVCYFTPREGKCVEGLRQGAYIASGAGDRQRRFCLADKSRLGKEAEEFWVTTNRQKKFATQPLKDIGKCGLALHCFPVDHSIPGACAWGIETS